MISNIETIYLKGEREINEDAFVVDEGKGIFSVIDGATGLGGLSGAMAAGIIRSALLEEEGPLLEKVLKGNAQIGQKTIEGIGIQNLTTMGEVPKFKRSSCGLAAIQFQSSKMHYVAAGDCILFIQYKNGDIRQVNVDQVDELDRVGIELAKKHWEDYVISEENPNVWDSEKLALTKRDIRSRIEDTLKQNRNKLNTIDGYGIIDGSKEAEEFLEYGVIPLINVKKILLLSDGLKIHSHRNQPLENEWLHSAKMAFDHGLFFLEKTITDMEKGDPACYQYPRFKQHDDKTGILLHLQ